MSVAFSPEPQEETLDAFQPRPRSESGPRRRSAARSLICGGLVLSGLIWMALSVPRSVWQVAATPAVAAASAEFGAPGRTETRLLTRPIRDIRPGMRVLAENPEHEGQFIEPLEIEPSEWRLISLQMEKADGSTLSIELLRPVQWLQICVLEHALETASDDAALDAFLDQIQNEVDLCQWLIGSTIELDLEELGAAGPARVTAIEACPPVEEGEGRIVTGTFSHTAANVIAVHVSGLAEPIGTTDTHPFWSEDRQAFVPAAGLRIGERLRTLDGRPSHVRAITRRAQPKAVYNLEVEDEHVYYVTGQGLLVHNNGCGGNVIASARRGRLGETLAGVPRMGKKRIDSLTGTAARRFPDELNDKAKVLREVKNRAHVRLTNQLKDYILHAQKNGYKFKLQTRKSARIDPRIQENADEQGVAIEILKGLKNP